MLAFRTAEAFVVHEMGSLGTSTDGCFDGLLRGSF